MPARRTRRLGLALIACLAALLSTALTPAASFASGTAEHSCAVLASGKINCWGQGGDGQLGNASITNSNVPVEVSGISTAKQVSVGMYHSCAVLASGKVNCWGYNGNGQLGNNSAAQNSSIPVEVSGISTATQVSAGTYGSCAVLASGKVNCWGDNEFGNLGNASNTPSLAPVEVSGISTATQVSVGNNHSCARLASGKVNCWGEQSNGKLGNGSVLDSNVPVEVSGISTATQVSAGDGHTCAVLASGKVNCWGYNYYGRLGNDSQTNSGVPVEVSGISTAKQVTTGLSHSCARLASGKVNCWGRGGRLGDGSQTNSLVPVEVSNISTATQIIAGAYHSCAVLASGKVNCWGLNEYGALGNDSTNDSADPVEVNDVSTFATLESPLDTTAPDAPGSFAAEAALVSNPVSTTVDFTLAEEGGTVECRFNDGAWGACTSVVGTAGKFTVSDLTGGEQSISVRQTDEASNTSNVGSVYLAPKLIDAPVGGLTKTGPEFKAVHASSGELWCKFQTASFNSDFFVPCFSGTGISYLSATRLSFSRGVPADGVTTDTFTSCDPICSQDGSYAVSYKQVIDGKSSLVSKATWVQDTTGPDTSTLTGGAAGITNSRSASFSFTSEEANVTFECSLDRGAYAACTSPKVLNDLPDGEHRLDVRAVDALGNPGYPAVANWAVDATAPAAPTVTSPANSSFSGTTVPFAASGEQGARFVCSLDGGAFTNCPRSNASPGDKGTITVGWNTKLHWGESPGWASLALGFDDPIDGPSWGPAFLPTSSFPDGVTFAALLTAIGYGSYAPSCEAAAQLLGQQKVLFGVTNGDSAPTTYNSFALDCSSTLAEVGAGGPAQFKSLAGGDHTLSVKQVDRAGNESSAVTQTWTVGNAPVLSKVGLKFNQKTKVTTLTLKAVADTRVRGNSVKWIEYFSHEKRPAANAVQHPAKIRQYARTVTLRAGEVAFWVRVKDTKGQWSRWYSTKK